MQTPQSFTISYIKHAPKVFGHLAMAEVYVVLRVLLCSLLFCRNKLNKL